MKRFGLLAIAAITLAACGGSGTDMTSKAVDACVHRPGSTATRSSCECAVNQAIAGGDTPERLISELHAGTVLADRVAFVAALECVQR